ncbi:MAG: hypothetical protein JXB29_02440 [Sedimentisphaerales bacterium]|nr:hypothetical protein [Sedimentisphaerales bacterium]
MAEEIQKHNSNCKSPLHKKHLCYIIAQGFHLSDEDTYRSLVDNPRYKCRHCGRLANSEKSLCEPTGL